MAILTAYFDESRMDHGKPYPVVGGYVASLENWIALVAEWRAVLQDNSLQSFHAKDCWANKREFKDSRRWGIDAKTQLVERLLDIIKDRVAVSILATLDNDAYVELSADTRVAVAGDKPRTPPRFNSQYELCGFSCSVLLGKWADSFKPTSSLPTWLVYYGKSPRVVAMRKAFVRADL